MAEILLLVLGMRRLGFGICFLIISFRIKSLISYYYLLLISDKFLIFNIFFISLYSFFVQNYSIFYFFYFFLIDFLYFNLFDIKNFDILNILSFYQFLKIFLFWLILIKPKILIFFYINTIRNILQFL